MSKGNSNSKSNSFLISKNQTSRFSARSRASLTRTLYVSLDNADRVIEGGPGLRRPINRIVGAPLFRVLCERVGGSAGTLSPATLISREEL